MNSPNNPDEMGDRMQKAGSGFIIYLRENNPELFTELMSLLPQISDQLLAYFATTEGSAGEEGFLRAFLSSTEGIDSGAADGIEKAEISTLEELRQRFRVMMEMIAERTEKA